MPTIGEAQRDATRRLRSAGLPSPDRDARALLLAATGLSPTDLIAKSGDPLDAQAAQAFAAYLGRRMAREPVSRILGVRSFYGLDFLISPDVLDPRPDSETLIDAAIETIRGSGDGARPLRVLDLGTGSGCLLLAILSRCEQARGVGVDISDAALDIARRNAIRLQLDEKAEFLRSDWTEKVDGSFDLVICNPPYLRLDEAEGLDKDVRDWDPPQALFAGMDGLDAYRRIAGEIIGVLSETGTAVFEVGIGQADAVAALLGDVGFSDTGFRRDLAGIKRCVTAHR